VLRLDFAATTAPSVSLPRNTGTHLSSTATHSASKEPVKKTALCHKKRSPSRTWFRVGQAEIEPQT